MKYTYLLITTVLVFVTYLAKAQNPWITITPNNSFYSFNFPDVPDLAIDSPMLKLFKIEIDSELTIFSAYQDQTESFADYLQQEDPMDSTDFANLPDSCKSPLFAYRDLMLFMWDSTSLNYYDTNFLDTLLAIKGIEFQITYLDSKTNLFRVLCARSFTKAFGMVNFVIDGPTSRINDILAIKSEYFDSIIFFNNN